MNAPRTVPTQPTTAAPKTYTLEEVLEQTYDAGRFAPRNKQDLMELAEDYYISCTLPDVYYAPQYRTDSQGKVIRDGQGQPVRIQYSEDDRRWHRRRGVAMAVVVMRYGAMLRVLPEAAINSIYLIDNKPSPSAALMVACVLARPDLCISIQTLLSTAEKCIIRVHRRGHEPEEIEATAEEYKHLHGRKTWTQYRKDMVYARCVARGMRRKFPDLFHGVYCVEERVDMQYERTQPVAPEPAEALEAVLSMANMPEQRDIAEPETAQPTEPRQAEPAAAAEQSSPALVLTAEEIAFVRDAMRKTVGDPVRTPMQRTALMGLLREYQPPPSGKAFRVQTIELMIALAQSEIDAAQAAAQKGGTR